MRLFRHKKLVNYLEMKPVQNVKEFTDEDGRITLLIPRFKSEWMRKWLIPVNRSRHFRVHLDETGSKVWRLIDGKRSTGEICEILTMGFTEETTLQNSIDLKVTKFLSTLYKNRFITFVSMD
jgi:hypothetical protein